MLTRPTGNVFLFTFSYDHLHTFISEHFTKVHTLFSLLLYYSLGVNTEEVKKKKESLQFIPLSNFCFSWFSRYQVQIKVWGSVFFSHEGKMCFLVFRGGMAVEVE